MNKQLTEGALFAGVMGFGLGLRRAGFKNLWAVEREPFCQAVIRSQFPETEIFSDVREVGKHNLRAVDVVTAGFPCQDLSVAGKRAGLGGSRSGLFWEVVRILGELRPAWVLLENVPGLFSSAGGRDFATVIRELGDLGYGVAWRTLDSQYFGVAQRRRRVFIVGRLGEPCPPEVLFECAGGAGDFETGGEAGAGVTGPLGGGAYGTGWRSEDDPNLAVIGALSPGAHPGGFNGQDAYTGQLIAHALSASNGHHGHSSPRGDGSDNLVATLQSSRRGVPSSEEAAGGHLVCGALDSFGGGPDDNSAQQQHIVIQDVRGGTRDKTDHGQGIGIRSGGPCYTLDGTSEHAVAFPLRSNERNNSDGVSANYAVSFAQNQRGELRTSRIAPQLTTGGGKPGEGYPAALCEAPDPDGMRDFAGLPLGLDSARYRALGNAVTAKVSEWIARRIAAASGIIGPYSQGVSKE